jgi:hypothetical protein
MCMRVESEFTDRCCRVVCHVQRDVRSPSRSRDDDEPPAAVAALPVARANGGRHADRAVQSAAQERLRRHDSGQ